MKNAIKIIGYAFVIFTAISSAYITIDYIRFCKKVKDLEKENDVEYINTEMDNIDIEIQ